MPYANKEKQRAYHADYYKKNIARYCTEEVKQRNKENRQAKREYYNLACTKRQRRRRQVIADIKSHYGCQNPNCCVTGMIPHYCLDLHHVNGEEKEFNVSRFTGYGADRIAKEINKCTVLCTVCHRKAHWGDLDVSGFPSCKVNEDLKILD